MIVAPIAKENVPPSKRMNCSCICVRTIAGINVSAEEDAHVAHSRHDGHITARDACLCRDSGRLEGL